MSELTRAGLMEELGDDSYEIRLMELCGEDTAANRKRARQFIADAKNFVRNLDVSKEGSSYLTLIEAALFDENSKKRFLLEIAQMSLLGLDFGAEMMMRHSKGKRGGYMFKGSINTAGWLRMLGRVRGLQIFQPVAVHKVDDFRYANRSDPEKGFYTDFHHEFSREDRSRIDEKTIEAAYVAWKYVDPESGVQTNGMRVIYAAEINAARANAKNSTAWSNWYEGMALKTVVLRAVKYMNLGRDAHVISAIQAAEHIESGELPTGDGDAPKSIDKSASPDDFSGGGVGKGGELPNAVEGKKIAKGPTAEKPAEKKKAAEHIAEQGPDIGSELMPPTATSPPSTSPDEESENPANGLSDEDIPF